MCEEGVLRHRTHGVVADTRGNCAAQPGWVAQERIKTSVAAIVQVDVDAAVEVKDKVSNCIGALNGEGVAVKGI